ncbi:hypothetical protein BDZ97DRAFT_1793575 [Flammula alnicola]|nr:hypothetical protein BDZ97DRAFT_1793575 [Flammula alnicola]
MLELMNTSHGRMFHAASPSELTSWRKVYTDSCILRGLVQSILSSPLQAISTLDHAIIIAGPFGTGRLDLILNTIRKIQSRLPRDNFSNTGIPSPVRSTLFAPEASQDTIPCPSPPSFLTFQSNFSRAPFILRNYARSWRALRDHAWRSATYLRSVAGPGRVVPVEVGHDYRSATWKQDLMPWDAFLSSLDFEDQPSSGLTTNLLYLAQHDLTKQFPSLREDIIVPDYVYASLTPTDYPDYRPPVNDDQILFNTWLGPKGAMSPAHTDPYYNCYVQVVGYKSVWLAPPSASSSMYPFAPIHASNDEPDMHLPSSELGNTSKVDVFSGDQGLGNFPDFVQQVIPVSMTATLSPGDMLFFPPGWWHAMKSETTSFSFSMWF